MQIGNKPACDKQFKTYLSLYKNTLSLQTPAQYYANKRPQ